MSASGSSELDTSLQYVRRACIDLGSGTIKLMIAVIDPVDGRIRETILEREVPVNHGGDLLCSLKTTGIRRLSDEIQEKGFEVLRSYRQVASELGITRLVGVATEVFRNAVNGADYIAHIKELLDIKITVISQKEEAELSFISVIALTGEKMEDACVWDSGNGSFQISTARPIVSVDRMRSCAGLGPTDLDCYMGAIGSSGAVSVFREVLGRDDSSKDLSFNPVSQETANRAIARLLERLPRDIPDWLLNRPNVTAAAGPNAIFKLCCDVLTHIRGGTKITNFTRDDVESALSACLMKSDEELSCSYPTHANATGPYIIVPKLSLLLAVMRHLGIGTVKAVDCLGSCPGIFRDLSYWR